MEPVSSSSVRSELDNTTLYNYQNYAASAFNKVSALATIQTAATILFAVLKPPFAKISDVMGRGESYIFTISCYVLSYMLSASSSSFNVYAAGYVIHNIAQTGTNIMNDIIISDISSMRWRGFAISLSSSLFSSYPGSQHSPSSLSLAVSAGAGASACLRS